MPRRFQLSLRALLVAILAVVCFFGGIWFERERRRREDEAAARRLDAQIQTIRAPFDYFGIKIDPNSSQKPIRRAR